MTAPEFAQYTRLSLNIAAYANLLAQRPLLSWASSRINGVDASPFDHCNLRTFWIPRFDLCRERAAHFVHHFCGISTETVKFEGIDSAEDRTTFLQRMQQPNHVILGYLHMHRRVFRSISPFTSTGRFLDTACIRRSTTSICSTTTFRCTPVSLLPCSPLIKYQRRWNL